MFSKKLFEGLNKIRFNSLVKIKKQQYMTIKKLTFLRPEASVSQTYLYGNAYVIYYSQMQYKLQI